MDASSRNSCLSPLDYKTEKYVLTKNRKIGVLHRLLHFGIICYIIGWVFCTKKGYQEIDSDPQFSVITKLKGASITQNLRGLQGKLWDVADFVKPSQGEDIFFLVTNFIATLGQVLNTCPESPLILDGRCSKHLDCAAGEPVENGNGIKTGKCVRLNNTYSTCEIFAWCPVESGLLHRKPLLSEAEHFTLFIKNTICFSKFNFSRTNTLDTSNETYFKSCRYDPVLNPYCPVFKIEEIINATGHSFEDIAYLGGVVAADIEWKCDLDQPAFECTPHYSFRLQDKNNNFRIASYYWDKERNEYRDLLKLYGIRFDISVTGEARRFGIIPTAVSLGTGCAFFGAATFLCDLILLYLDEKAVLYRDWKYEVVRPPKASPESTTACDHNPGSINTE
ncbi:P2X purinoceptor 6-like [Bombina bombina]|uniref:P2X purinoceptor 6-like n=1 Tax=Bombina bombina TaxID=8345 RepID=UPI00235A917C|nr:P2X purinoceptor 6-like [Bombina bombina]